MQKGVSMKKNKVALLLAVALTVSSLPATAALAQDTSESAIAVTSEESAEIEVADEVVSGDMATEGVTENASAGVTEMGTEESVDASSAETAVEVAADEAEEEVDAEDVIEEEISSDEQLTVTDGWEKVGTTYYYYKNGEKVTGWVSSYNKWYYMDAANDGAMVTGWNEIDGYMYYMTQSGDAVTGWQIVDGDQYYFAPGNAYLVTGWKKISGFWFYFDKTVGEPGGVMATGWTTVGSYTYYMNASGIMVTGLRTIDGKKYIFDSNNGNRKSGWVNLNGKYYYADPAKDDALTTGWKKVGNFWYYFNSDAAMVTGWIKSGNYYYYFHSTGAMATGWANINGRYFYFNENGVMMTGWQKLGGVWYYLTSNGDMVTGVKQVDGVYYFFHESGALTTTKGWQKAADGYTYYTYEDGRVAVNTTIDGKNLGADGKVTNDPDAIAQQYSSPTNYLIVADRTDHILGVYKGSKGNWTRVKGYWKITTGAVETPTPTGEHWIRFKDSSPYGWEQFRQTKAAWCSYCSGGFYIHSILYEKSYSNNISPANTPVVDGSLGYNMSHSCIRLATANAKWVYDNIPVNTKVVVYTH